nr:hypothetical protein [Paracoccus halophilus]
MKLLSDKREIDSFHGQIALGFLIVQDLVVVLAMIVLPAIGIAATAEGGGPAGKAGAAAQSGLSAGYQAQSPRLPAGRECPGSGPPRIRNSLAVLRRPSRFRGPNATVRYRHPELPASAPLAPAETAQRSAAGARRAA